MPDISDLSLNYGPSDQGESADRAAARPVVPDHEMLRCIGRGSYGEVWLARSAVGTLRAVKVVYRNRFKDPRPYEREFSGIQKYEPMSRSNDGLVDVLQIGRNDGKGYFYYVMELADDAEDNRSDGALEGWAEGQTQAIQPPIPSLQSSSTPALQHPFPPTPNDAAFYAPKTLAAEIKARGRLPVDACIRLGMTLNLALGHLHRNGLLHRDVKPSNIIFVNGVPKLADIGLVTDLAEAQSFVGTEGFIPPEGPNSPQADLYALGKVLYEASMGKDRTEFPEPCSGLGMDADSRALMELNAVLLKACAPKREDRYQSAEAMNADLALLHSGQSVRDKQRLERRVKFLTRAGAVTVATMVLGAVPYFVAIKEARLARLAAREKARQAERADREAARARAAEGDAREKLWQSYLNEAKARRFSGQAGRRAESLTALKQAARIRPNLQLRNEAIACLALTDMRVGKVWDLAPDNLRLAYDGPYERYALLCLTNGLVTIRRTQDDAQIMQLGTLSQPGSAATGFFSPDGRWLGILHRTEHLVLEIWNLERKELAANFTGRDCSTLDFSADSSLAAISFHNGASSDNSIVIYDLVTRQTRTTIKHGTLAHTIRFHPSARRLATSSDESNEVRIYDLDAETHMKKLMHPGSVAQVAWSQDGELLAAGCADNQVYLWNVASGTAAHVLPGHSGFPREVSFSSDGQFLASRGWDGTLRFWDPWTGQTIFKQLVVGWTYGFSRPGYRFGYEPLRGKMGFFEMEPSRECRLFRPGSVFKSLGLNCDFSPDGRWLLTAHEDGVRLWNLADGKVLRFLSEEGTRFAIFGARQDQVLMASGRGIVEWTLACDTAGRLTEAGTSRTISTDAAEELSRGQSGAALEYVAGMNFHVWNFANGTKTTFPWRGSIPRQARTWLHGSLSPDGKLWAGAITDSACDALPVCILDIGSNHLIKELPNAGNDGARPLFSPDGKWLLTGNNLEYRLWNPVTWQPRYVIPRGDAGYAAFMAFSPDCTVLALALTRDTVKLVEADSGNELAMLVAPEAHDIYHLAFSRDGTQLAVMYRNGPAHVWDLRLIRSELAAMNLDWETPAYRAAPSNQAARN